MSAPSIKRNFAYNVAYQVLALVLPLVTSPYLSRVVGPEGMGTYSFSHSVAYYFVMFAMLGVNNYGNREVARVRDNQLQLRIIFWEIWTLQAFVGLFAFLVYVFYFMKLSSSAVTLVWILYVVSSMFDVNWLFFGLEEFRVTVGRNFIIKLITFISTFILVRGQNAVIAYCFLMSSSMLLSVLVLWPFVFSRVGWKRPSVRGVLSHVPGNIVLFIPVVAVSLYSVLDKVMLGYMSTLSETGYFENAFKMSQIPFTLVAALGTVMLPRMSSLIAQGKRSEGRRYLGLSMKFAMALSIALSFGLSGISPVFTPVFFGHSFTPASPVIIILMINMPFMAWANVLRTQYLIPSGKDKAYVLSVIVGAITNIVVNITLIPGMGAMGAAWGSTLAEIAVCIVQVFAVYRDLPQFQWVKACIPYMIIGLIMFAEIRLIGNMMGTMLLTLIIQIISGAVVYLSLIWYWMFKTKDDLYMDVISPALINLVKRKFI